jgi:hypothetical protein
MKAFFLISACLTLIGCGPATRPPTAAAINAAPSRELTPAEKAAIAPQIAASLKDPSAAQFKWMPVIDRQRDGVTDYCSLVNGKNSYGGYTGYSRFYAQLVRSDKGQFLKAEPRGFETLGSEVNMFEGTPFSAGICEQYGYKDFTQAK